MTQRSSMFCFDPSMSARSWLKESMMMPVISGCSRKFHLHSHSELDQRQLTNISDSWY